MRLPARETPFECCPVDAVRRSRRTRRGRILCRLQTGDDTCIGEEWQPQRRLVAAGKFAGQVCAVRGHRAGLLCEVAQVFRLRTTFWNGFRRCPQTVAAVQVGEPRRRCIAESTQGGVGQDGERDDANLATEEPIAVTQAERHDSFSPQASSDGGWSVLSAQPVSKRRA